MIGLLTPYAVNNYGTKLQAYALQKIMSEFEDVEIIQYVPQIMERINMKIEGLMHPVDSFKDIIPDQTTKKLDAKLERLRKDAISSFDSRLQFSPVIMSRAALSKYCKKYSAVVCGSDQIWNPINLKMQVYMLEFVPHIVRRIAYAPSFGVDALPERLISVYKKRISNIEFLSVREESGCRIAMQLGRPDAIQCLDPTLVTNESNWLDFAKSGKYDFSKPYIFCYFLGTREIGREIAAYIRDATGCVIVNLPHFKTYVRCDENFADIDLYDVNPVDFISLIAKATYVITDSFHGTVFSTVFRKNFYCVERHDASSKVNTNNRLHSYLNLLGLENRLINNLNDLKEDFDSICWDKPYTILTEKRTECRQFVEKALKGKRNDL